MHNISQLSLSTSIDPSSIFPSAAPQSLLRDEGGKQASSRTAIDARHQNPTTRDRAEGPPLVITYIFQCVDRSHSPPSPYSKIFLPEMIAQSFSPNRRFRRFSSSSSCSILLCPFPPPSSRRQVFVSLLSLSSHFFLLSPLSIWSLQLARYSQHHSTTVIDRGLEFARWKKPAVFFFLPGTILTCAVVGIFEGTYTGMFSIPCFFLPRHHFYLDPTPSRAWL